MIIVLAKSDKKYSLEDEIKILSEIKETLKNDEVVLEVINEKGYDLSILDGINIDFSDEIDVSAKTINSRIYLNKELLNEPKDIMNRYAVHELVHALQHMDSNKAEKIHEAYDQEDYLDRPDELEAFQTQIKFDANQRGTENVVDYVEDLLDYHEIPEYQRSDKKRELLKKI